MPGSLERSSALVHRIKVHIIIRHNVNRYTRVSRNRPQRGWAPTTLEVATLQADPLEYLAIDLDPRRYLDNYHCCK